MPSAGPFSAYMAHRRDNTARPGAAFRADAAASTLKRLVDEDGAIVYQDTASGFVISIPHRDDKGQIDRTETWPLESERITAYMTQLFMSAPENTEGYVPTLTCLNDARRALWSEATMAGRQVTTALRVAERDGFTYIARRDRNRPGDVEDRTRRYAACRQRHPVPAHRRPATLSAASQGREEA